MSKNPFKVGDRVFVYDSVIKYGPIHITFIDPNGLLTIDGLSGKVHYKQCRRAVKKKRREWLIATEGVTCCTCTVPCLNHDLKSRRKCIKVHEVKP